MNIVVIGASADRSKFGNKAVRAYLAHGHTVYPVNPRENVIEGQKVFRSILDVPVDVDTTLVYLPPHITLHVLPEIAAKGTTELYLNPGSESPDVLAAAKRHQLSPILACSIIAVGANPNAY